MVNVNELGRLEQVVRGLEQRLEQSYRELAAKVDSIHTAHVAHEAACTERWRQTRAHIDKTEAAIAELHDRVDGANEKTTAVGGKLHDRINGIEQEAGRIASEEAVSARMKMERAEEKWSDRVWSIAKPILIAALGGALTFGGVKLTSGPH